MTTGNEFVSYKRKARKYGIRKRKRCDDSGPVLLQRGLAWGQIALGGIRWNGDQGRRSGSENLPERNEQPVQGGAGRVFVLKRDNRIANAVRKLSELAEGNHNFAKPEGEKARKKAPEDEA